MTVKSVLLITGLLILLSGCAASPDVEETALNPFEQLLLSTATEDALAKIALPAIAGERVFVDSRYLDSYMEPYVLGAIRDLVSRNGALIANLRSEASVIIEPRSGALGIDENEMLIGVPSVPVVIPAAGSFETPDLPLYGSQKVESITSVSLLAYRQDGSHLFSERALGRSYIHNYTFLFVVKMRFTDLPPLESFGS